MAKEEDKDIQANKNSNLNLQVNFNLESSIHALKVSGKPLPESTRSYFESRFGKDFSQVRVHNDANANLLARSVNARAFTVGRDIVFRSGQYTPETYRGKRLLAHELTHVVQQNKEALYTADKSLQRKDAAPANPACADTVFYIHLDLPLLKDRYFKDGKEINESKWNSEIKKDRGRKDSCEVKVSEEIEIKGPNPTINAYLLYVRNPCCKCFRGDISWDITVDGVPQPGRKSIGKCAGEVCCGIKKTVPLSLSVAGYKIAGNVTVDGNNYPTKS